MDDVLASEYDVDTDSFIRPSIATEWIPVHVVTGGTELHSYYDPAAATFHWGTKRFSQSWVETDHMSSGTRENLKAVINVFTAESGDRDAMSVALRVLKAFDHEANVINRYAKLRALNHQLETIGSKLSNLGELPLASAAWGASAKIMARRHDLHPDFIAAKNSKGHDWVDDQEEAEAETALSEAVTARETQPQTGPLSSSPRPPNTN